MTNEQFSIFMIEFTKLESKLNALEAAVKALSEPLVIDQDIRFTSAPPGHGANYIGVMDYLPGVDKLN